MFKVLKNDFLRDPALEMELDLDGKTDEIELFSVNSNGYDMLTAFADDTFDGWFNLSKHAVVDDGVFRRPFNVTPDIVREFKSRQPRAHVRAQCVLGVSPLVRTVDDVWDFVGYFRRSVDNFSFRNLIIQDEQGSVHPLFRELRNTLLDDGCCMEQAIQDYYVYETYERDGVNITLSWSNMELLRQYNESHQDSNFLEEIIVHPDGTVTGSWNKKSLVIFDAKELNQRTLRTHSGEPAEGQVSVAPKCVQCDHVSHCRHGWGGCEGGCGRGRTSGGGC